MKARDSIIYTFHDFLNRKSKPSSCAYNPYEQDKAIRSAEEQVSIANNAVRSATTKLTTHVDALEVAVHNYFDKLHKLGVPGSEASRVAGPANYQPQSQSVAQAPTSMSNASSMSQAASSSSSVGNILVSLSSNVGVIYSLVSRHQKSSH